MRVYRERATTAIARCGGHVASYAGDGILAFFGYPQAREDAAERSVRAGLAIIEATGDVKSRQGPALKARVGIATGLVVNDQAGASAEAQVAVGRPLTVAAEMQGSRSPERSSSPTARARCSAVCSRSRISAITSSRARPKRCARGR